MLGLERRLRHAVATEVVRDKPELFGERAFVLLRPTEVVLRPTVDEQNRRPIRYAPLAHVQPQTAAAAHGVSLHPPGVLLRSLLDCRHGSILATDQRERIGWRALSFGASLLIFRAQPTQEGLFSLWPRRDTGRVQVLASAVFVGRERELEELER